jgi:hypothetical protein
MLDGERPVQAHADSADFFALLGQVFDRCFERFRRRTHQHDHALGFGMADVVEQFGTGGRSVWRTCPSACTTAPGQAVVERVDASRGPGSRHPGSGGAAQDGAVGGQGAGAVFAHQVIVDHRAQVVVFRIRFLTSCEVRKPSKKCRKGMRVSGWRHARSGQGRGLPARRRRPAWPSRSGGRPSHLEWSPKIESAWAATSGRRCGRRCWSSSPAILYILGIINSKPCEAVKVVVSARSAARHARRRLRRLQTAFRPPAGPCPKCSSCLGRPFIGQFAHIGRRGDGVNCNDF